MAPPRQSFRRKAERELYPLTGAGILVDADGNHFGINQVGVRIWDLLADARSLDELVGALRREFDITETRCRHEAERFLGELLERSLVERVGPGEVDLPAGSGR
jgi:Coenzyme PQQ synthesis protein D (PqqD)